MFYTQHCQCIRKSNIVYNVTHDPKKCVYIWQKCMHTISHVYTLIQNITWSKHIHINKYVNLNVYIVYKYIYMHQTNKCISKKARPRLNIASTQTKTGRNLFHLPSDCKSKDNNLARSRWAKRLAFCRCWKWLDTERLLGFSMGWMIHEIYPFSHISWKLVGIHSPLPRLWEEE